MPALAVAALLLLLTAAAGAALLRRGLVSFLLALYLLAVGEVVVATELLSLVHRVGTAGYLVLESLAAVAVAGLWYRRGRPVPPLPRLDVRDAVRRHPVLAALALVVGAALAYEAFLVLAVPPNTWDAMTYHLSRAAGWSHADAVEYLDAHTTRQDVVPPNAEIQILWTLVLLGRDTLAGAPQFVAQLAVLVATFGTARRLGFARPAAAFASLLFATLSGVALQATSTQNDLAAAAPVAIAAYFVLGRTRADLLLAGASVGLALGTKNTVIVALPALLLLAVLTLPRRRLALAAAAAAAGFVLLGSYGYVLNLVESGTPLGRSPENEAFRPEQTLRGTVSTAARVGWDFVDFSGFTLDWRVEETIGRYGELAFDGLGIEHNPVEASTGAFWFRPNTLADEDRAYFGPLGFLLLLPLSAVVLVAWPLRRVTRGQAAVALALPLFVVGLALTQRYNPWLGRFLTLPVALVMPLAATVYTRRALAAGAAAFGAVTLLAAHAGNPNKPPAAAFGATPRIEAVTAKQGELRPALEWLEARVPERAALGVRLGPDDWDYPLYGPRLQRRLVSVDSLADARGVGWVVVGSGERLAGAPGWREVRFPNGWRVLQRL
jgi:hypothetical protein